MAIPALSSSPSRKSEPSNPNTQPLTQSSPPASQRRPPPPLPPGSPTGCLHHRAAPARGCRAGYRPCRTCQGCASALTGSAGRVRRAQVGKEHGRRMTHGGVGSRRAQLGAACALAWMPGPSPTCRWCRRIRRRASRRPLCTTLYSVSACLGGGTCDQRRACSAELAARGSAQEGAMPPPEHKPGSKTPVGKPRPTAKETGVANCRVVQRELHAPRSSEQIKHALGGCSRTRDTRSSRSASSPAKSLAPGTADRALCDQFMPA